MDLQTSDMMEQTQKIKVVLLGDRSVGKTSIIKRFIRNQFTDKQNPTVGIDYMFKTVSYRGRSYKLELWDTAGQEKYRSLVKSYLKDADCSLFIYDVNQMQTYYHLVDWISCFNDSRDKDSLSFIVGNKIDLRDFQHSQDVGDLNFITNRQLKQLQKYEHFEVSAKEGSNIDQLFNKLLSAIQSRKMSVLSTRSSQQHLEQQEAAKKRCCF